MVSASIHPDQLIPKIEIDAEIPLELINFKTYNVMNQMGPFGPQNMLPVFGTKNVVVKTLPKVLKEKHLKGFLKSTSSPHQVEFIGFGLGEKINEMKVGVPFDVTYHLEVNEYLGNRSLILNLMDIRFDT